ncbi:putative serine/threonine-protein kinase PRKY [Galendromus occidentalis]|uniref:Serine/threonine-protein kinase greatwall n=1 Tax=Galendromus occidentalis TaxID=34638 RepID=A0AAJ6VUU6_9ACAR|nr:putative serine/threonine-protein kinase PRKY [Galendromus occidentalis]
MRTRRRTASIVENYSRDLESAEATFAERYERNECPKQTVVGFLDLTEIASGTYGTVYKGKWLSKDEGGQTVERFYAIKRQGKREDPTGAIREKKILFALSVSSFVVKLHWSWKTHYFCYLVMDYAPNGNLYQIGRIPHSEETVELLLCQIVMGLEFIHACNVIWRDLKPNNILVFERGLLKLSDFGMASDRPRDISGTLKYMAPEVFTGEPQTGAVDW